jgi:hypothetical protein
MAFFIKCPKLNSSIVSGNETISTRVVKTNVCAILVLLVSGRLSAFGSAFRHIPADNFITVVFTAQRQ